jgi:hypothetical protein
MACVQILEHRLFSNIRNFQEVIEVKLLRDVHVCECGLRREEALCP